jgi:hypothetical protein
MPPYAESFCEALAEYICEILPITRPTESKIGGARKQSAIRPRKNTAEQNADDAHRPAARHKRVVTRSPGRGRKRLSAH